MLTDLSLSLKAPYHIPTSNTASLARIDFPKPTATNVGVQNNAVKCLLGI